MIILTKLEAKVYEAIKEERTFSECEAKFEMNSRNLTSICQRLVTFNMLDRIKTKTYIALPATYEIQDNKLVKKHRKEKSLSFILKSSLSIPEEAATYIVGHYSLLTRSQLLQKLHEAGYKIQKYQLNEFIVENKIDRLPTYRSHMKIAL